MLALQPTLKMCNLFISHFKYECDPTKNHCNLFQFLNLFRMCTHLTYARLIQAKIFGCFNLLLGQI